MITIENGIRYDRKSRWITVGERIEHITATQFENALKDITSTRSQKPIIVFLRGSRGGDIYPCLKIYEIIEHSKVPIFTIAVDIVFSGFFYILQAGQKRVATQETKLIFHRATQFFENNDMNAGDLREAADYLLMLDGAQLHIFCKHGRPIKKVISIFYIGATLTATEAQNLKLVDEIIEEDSIQKMCARVRRTACRQKAST
ncbi:MAG: ATP-dependent Clp protease proteolytic subunit [bacterium]|nr:ATP-dependent Clp protease proteolytic subunit [bacterium]